MATVTRIINIANGVGPAGPTGSDATVTESAVISALGFTPADVADLGTAASAATEDFAAASHTQAASTISDSTTAGRAVLTASDESNLLRAARVNGNNSLASLPVKLWRLKSVVDRQASAIPGSPVAASRFRVLALGDSVASNPIRFAQGTFGFGGGHSGDIWGQWAKESGAITNSEDWTKFPGGQYLEINAGTAGATYIEKLDYAPEFQSVFVRYWASSSNGSFKVQYKVNKTGSWTDCNGTYDISTGGGSIDSGTKVVNTNNGGAGRYAQARFTLPAMDYYHIRIQAVTGAGNAPVQISDVTFNAGGWFFDPTPAHLKTNVAGAGDVSWALGGQTLAEFVTTPAAVWNDAMLFADPHLIVFKWANDAFVNVLEAHWDTYIGRVRSAAPNATLVVCGSHPSSSAPTRLDAERMAVDDWLRDWCADNDCIFVDVRQSFPAYTDSPGSADDIWYDGIHLYSGIAPDYANGTTYVNMLVWRAVADALLNHTSGQNGGANITNVLPGFPTEVRLNNPSVSDTQASYGKNSFFFVGQPRRSMNILMRDTDASYYPSLQYWNSTAGMAKIPSDNATNYTQNGLYLISGGFGMASFSSRGANFAYNASPTRSVQGWRFLNTDTGTPTLVAQSASGQTGAVLAVDINATTSTAGSTMWGWYNDGRVVYDGTTSDANKTTFTYAEPAAALTIHTPVCATAGTGANARVIGVIPSYTSQAAGNAAVGVAEVFYAEDVGKVFTRLS